MFNEVMRRRVNMKKVFEFIKNMLMVIVHPRRILELFRVKNLDQNYYKVLGNNHVVKVLAFFIAIFIVVSARYTPSTASGAYQTLLEDVPVDILIDEDYTFFGIVPIHINVILSGDRTLIDMLMFSSSNVTAYVDLRGLEPGTHHNILIQVEGGETEQIVMTPSQSIVTEIDIVRIETIQLPILTQNMLPNDLPELDMRYGMDVTVTPEYVTVRGPQSFLDEIVAIRVSYDASIVNGVPGLSSLSGFVVAHDRNALPVGEIEIHPSVVDVEIQVFENVRTIHLGINDQRPLNMPTGYDIRNVTVTPTEIEVWGDFEQMNETIELPRINFAQLDEEGRLTVQIAPLLPSGVYSQTEEVEITVDYEAPPPSGEGN